MARIGIMGGTFDPIHNGHLVLGSQAYEEYSLDEVWFMPSGQPPHKRDHVITDSHDRCEMVRLAIIGRDEFVFSDFEVSTMGYTYTANTLAALKQHYPEHHFYFIVGADSLFQLEDWYHPERVLASVTLLAAGRAYPEASCSIGEQIEYLKHKYKGNIHSLHSPDIDVSSSMLRTMAAKGEDLTPYLPQPVAAYIQSRHLYEVSTNG